MKQYNSALKSWWNFCEVQKYNPYSSRVEVILDFLAQKLSEGASYGTLNSSRSAILLIAELDEKGRSSLERFFRGAFRVNPPRPKYSKIWDVQTVIQEIEKWYPLENLDFQKLSYKLAILLALGTGFRVQALGKIKIEGISVFPDRVEIKIEDLTKTSRPGAYNPFANFPFFISRPNICIAKTIQFYLKKNRIIKKGGKKVVFINQKTA